MILYPEDRRVFCAQLRVVRTALEIRCQALQGGWMGEFKRIDL